VATRQRPPTGGPAEQDVSFGAQGEVFR